jgi:hypothetical protein
MSGVWELEGSFGAESWFQKDGQFSKVTVGSEVFVLPQSAADVADLGARPSPCGHGSLWPKAFKYCPQCATELPAAPEPRSATWSAPFGGPGGLPVINDPGVPLATQRMELPMPAAGSFGFFACGEQGALFAYDLQSGRLFRATRIDDPTLRGTTLPVVWDENPPRIAPATRLPRWSWSASAHSTGAAIPTDGGAVWLNRVPGRRTGTIPLESRGTSLQAVGGAAGLRDAAVVPVSVDGRVRFAVWSYDTAAWALVDPAAEPEAPADHIYAAPAGNADEAFWSGPDGLLRVSQLGGAVSGEFVPWPSGFKPQPGLRPLVLPDGGLHLLGWAADEKLTYQAMLPRAATPRHSDARGYFISYGGGVFREGKRFRQPGDRDSLGAYTVDNGEFLAPLLAFGERSFLVAVCLERPTLRKFFEPGGGGTRRRCQFAMCGAASSLEPLNQVVEAAAVWELVPFIYASRLFVYAAADNHCWAWPLQPARRG